MNTEHLARLHGRLIQVCAREAAQISKLEATRSEAAALVAEIEYLSRGDGPAAAWNADFPTGSPVRWGSGATVTRSSAWVDADGQAVVLVRGSLLPVPLVDVRVVEVAA